MDHHVQEFFQQASDEVPKGNFHRVIALHEEPDICWKEASSLVPKLSKGWFELARLPIQDRIEFIHGYWMVRMPYRTGLDKFLNRFFNQLDDIGVFLSQKKFEDPYEAHLVYSLRHDRGFFRGGIGADDADIALLQKQFTGKMFPQDYLAFLQIHNGFSKTTDVTGLIPIPRIIEAYQRFQEDLAGKDPLVTSQGTIVNPASLIPFYESFGQPFFQCFWADWYPEEEMGNIYYSGTTHTISDVFNAASFTDNMAFCTFTDWLMFYLEQIE